jgi:hypothetical protein
MRTVNTMRRDRSFAYVGYEALEPGIGQVGSTVGSEPRQPLARAASGHQNRIKWRNMRRLLSFLRAAGAIIANLAVAVLGPALLEGLLESLVDPHALYTPRNYGMATAAVAFVLGCGVAWKSNSVASHLVGLAGLIGLACRLSIGPAGAAFPSSPEWLLVEWASLRVIAYSLGSLLCASLSRPRVTASV